jgi:UDP-N-acetylmuramoyl-tripeptide--D-alanyl-D-alanine ligase
MVGVRAAEVVDELVAVGELGRQIAEAAYGAGLPRSVVTELADSDAAIVYLKNRLKAGDVVLIKGSRGMRMDRIVSALEGR